MLKNKIVLLTGATDGIGLQAAYKLAQAGVTLLMHGRNAKKGHKLQQEISKKTKNKKIHYFNADFEAFEEPIALSKSIKQSFKKIDILINNAGLYQKEKKILPTGHEKTFMVNHLAPFTLTLNVLPLLRSSEAGRIVNVSSMVHAHSIDFENLNGEKHYSGSEAYSLSKLCNLLFTYRLSKELKNTNITVNALHPGVINTKLLRTGWGPFGSSPSEGADRLFFAVISPEFGTHTARYYEHDQAVQSARISYDETVQEKLWNLSLQYLKKHTKT